MASHTGSSSKQSRRCREECRQACSRPSRERLRSGWRRNQAIRPTTMTYGAPAGLGTLGVPWFARAAW
eukprot:15869712-Heterocapsa_arctica.AAC.1